MNCSNFGILIFLIFNFILTITDNNHKTIDEHLDYITSTYPHCFESYRRTDKMIQQEDEISRMVVQDEISTSGVAISISSSKLVINKSKQQMVDIPPAPSVEPQAVAVVVVAREVERQSTFTCDFVNDRILVSAEQPKSNNDNVINDDVMNENNEVVNSNLCWTEKEALLKEDCNNSSNNIDNNNDKDQRIVPVKKLKDNMVMRITPMGIRPSRNGNNDNNNNNGVDCRWDEQIHFHPDLILPENNVVEDDQIMDSGWNGMVVTFEGEYYFLFDGKRIL